MIPEQPLDESMLRALDTRRVQMVHAVTFAALVLEEVAADKVDPERARFAAANLTAAALRIATPKPRRRRALPKPGHSSRKPTAATLEDLAATTAALAAMERRT
jgi:hypothetical protein